VRVVLAEDNALLRAGLAELLRQEEIDVVGQAADVPHLLRVVRDTQARRRGTRRPDAADAHRWRDSRPPGRSGPSTVTPSASWSSPITWRPRYALDLLADGAHGVGYLLKDRVLGPGDLADAIRRVAAGGSAIDPQVIEHLLKRRRSDISLATLTVREREVLTAGRRGQVEPVGRRRDARQREDRRGLHRTHLRQARPD
jgi:hypothetical protein